MPQHIEVRQGEARIQSRGILGQSAVANLAKAPQALEHVKDMLDSGPSGGSAPLNPSLLCTQGRPAIGAPVDTVADTDRLRGLAMRLIPVSLVAKYLSFFAVQQLGHLRAVVLVRRRRAQTVHNAAPIGADVRLHAKSIGLHRWGLSLGLA